MAVSFNRNENLIRRAEARAKRIQAEMDKGLSLRQAASALNMTFNEAYGVMKRFKDRTERDGQRV